MGVGDLENSKDVPDWRVFEFWKVLEVLEILELQCIFKWTGASGEVTRLCPSKAFQAGNVLIKMREYG